MLKELKLEKNVCFKKITEKDNIIHITKSKHESGSSREVSEICDIYSKLEKYKKHFNIKISTEEVIIKLK